MTEKIAAAKFRVDDNVRFIGTDTIFTVKHHHHESESHEYQVQRGDDVASIEWVSECYLEHAEASCPRMIDASSGPIGSLKNRAASHYTSVNF